MTNFCVAAAASPYPSSGMVMLIGMVVVFAVLLLLTWIFLAFGKLVGGSKETDVIAPLPIPQAAPAPIIADGVPEEVVAVIAAAVAAMSADGVQYSLRRIRPACKPGARSAWATAGIAENTRSF